MEIIILAVVAAFLALFVIIIHNGIVTRHNAVKRAWANVINRQRRKDKTFPDLEEIANRAAGIEIDMLKEVTALRSSIKDMDKGSAAGAEFNYGAMAAAEAATKNIQSGLHLAVEAYPDLKASQLYNNLMKELSEMQEDTTAAISLFNHDVESFNNGLQVFPNNLVNSMVSKRTVIQEFSDAEASEAFDYKPNL